MPGRPLVIGVVAGLALGIAGGVFIGRLTNPQEIAVPPRMGSIDVVGSCSAGGTGTSARQLRAEVKYRSGWPSDFPNEHLNLALAWDRGDWSIDRNSATGLFGFGSLGTSIDALAARWIREVDAKGQETASSPAMLPRGKREGAAVFTFAGTGSEILSLRAALFDVNGSVFETTKSISC